MKAPIYYAGIGSRETPEHICELMTNIARELSDMGLILRSGHADKADLAFEYGANGKAEIYLPWRSFNSDAPLKGTAIVGAYNIQSEDLAMKYHPAWQKCSDGAKRLHNRNVYQILGPGLGHHLVETISKFVVCWTKDGKASGGTGQALRIAEAYNIPIFNLYNENDLPRLGEYLQELGF